MATENKTLGCDDEEEDEEEKQTRLFWESKNIKQLSFNQFRR